MPSSTDNSPGAWHDQGQTDAAENKYEPPRSSDLLERLIDSQDTLDQRVERRESYDAGWDHAKNQTK